MSTERERARRDKADVVERGDPRATRTRDAVLAVLRENIRAGGTDLSVAELCRRATVHRVTFYGHWPDIDSAVADAYADEVDRLAAVPDRVVATATTSAELAAAYAAALRDQLAEIQAHRLAYRRLFASGSGRFEEQLRESLRTRALAAIAQLGRLDDRHHGSDDTAAGFLAAGVASCYRDWASSDREDRESVALDILQQLPAWWPDDRKGSDAAEE